MATDAAMVNFAELEYRPDGQIFYRNRRVDGVENRADFIAVNLHTFAVTEASTDSERPLSVDSGRICGAASQLTGEYAEWNIAAVIEHLEG